MALRSAELAKPAKNCRDEIKMTGDLLGGSLFFAP
jgi:hypothetical protein